jgi:hypothetical protein
MIKLGAKVYRRDADGWDNVGDVVQIGDGWVVVDFFEWKERWREDQFVIEYLFHQGYDVLVPICPGEVIMRFQQKEGGS